MINYKQLVNKILENDDYISVLREVKSYNVKDFKTVVDTIRDFDKRVKAKGIDTKLTYDIDKGTLEWFVDQGYMKDKDRTLSITYFDNGTVYCDKNKKFNAGGVPNLNELTDINQILKNIEIYVYGLEREDKNKEKDKSNEKAEKSREEIEDENFKFNPAVEKVLTDLKTAGESLITKFKNAPPLKIDDKEYKIENGDLFASTEGELIASFEFPRADEVDIYNSDDSDFIQKLIVNHYNKNGFKNFEPQFRLDMDRSPYFYAVVGKLPVKKTTGPEARAILNYYDGNKVRFQPR